jgi:nuclear transport factor 2 (NTF2) superfamily protein
MPESRPPLPPFTLETAIQKVRMAEDAWNTRDPQRVALAYTMIVVGGTAQNPYGAAPRSKNS